MVVMYYVFQEGNDLQPCWQSLYCVCEICVATQNNAFVWRSLSHMICLTSYEHYMNLNIYVIY